MIAAAAIETRDLAAEALKLCAHVACIKLSGGVRAVSDISLDVAMGSIFAIIGPAMAPANPRS